MLIAVPIPLPLSYTTGSQPAHVSGAINVVLVTCLRFHSLKMMQAAYSGELGVLGWITEYFGLYSNITKAYAKTAINPTIPPEPIATALSMFSLPNFSNSSFTS